MHRLILLLLFLFFTSGSGDFSTLNASKQKERPLIVMVSIMPQVEFVKAVGGHRVRVIPMLPPGASPTLFEPAPRLMTTLSIADMYVEIGHLPFERQHMHEFYKLNDHMEIVDPSRRVKVHRMSDFSLFFDAERERLLTPFDDHEYLHRTKEHGDMDPYIWMSPDNVEIMVNQIFESLVKLDPEYATYYEDNKNQYIKQLRKLDAFIKKKMSTITHFKVLVFHPAYGYFANRYGIRQISIEHHGKNPTAKQLKAIIEYAKKNDVRAIFTQIQYNRRFADAIASSIGGKAILVDPLEENYIENMKFLATELSEALK